MHSSLSLLAQLFPVLVIVYGSLDSKFHQTNVLEGITECRSKSFNEYLSELTTFSLIECGRVCSSDEDCRRFMFDEETSLCSLFESGEYCVTDKNVTGKICFQLKSICNDVNCTRCPIGYYGDQCEHIIQDCTDGIQKSVVPSKTLMSYIQPSTSEVVLEVKCEFGYGGWLLINNRDASCLELDFNKTWNEYSTGFGHSYGNYWLGLENTHNILQNLGTFTLNVVMLYGQADQGWGYYNGFYISDADDNYRITIGSYSPHNTKPSGDSLTNGTYSINGRPFSTYDRDYSNNDCPGRFNGGWWFLDDPVCSRANVIGKRPDAVVPLESTWHWLDNLGTRTDIYRIILRIRRN